MSSGLALASITAARNEQAPVPSSHNPSPGTASTVSAVVSTKNCSGSYRHAPSTTAAPARANRVQTFRLIRHASCTGMVPERIAEGRRFVNNVSL